MSAVFAPSWPSSRILLGWWRELAAWQPRQMRVGHLLFHRLEALVRIRRSRPLDRWQLALLRLTGTRIPSGDEPINLLNDLQIDKQLLGQLVRELTVNGLLHRNGSGLWQMTPEGRRALETGQLSVAGEERRAFVFADNSTLGLAPHFLSLQPDSKPVARTHPATAASAPSFDVAHLEECLRQTADWKARHRFPSDVEALLPPRSGAAPTANWRHVILDSVSYHSLVFLHTAEVNGVSSLLGFPVRPEGWTLEAKPLFILADAWKEALPDLKDEPSPEQWRQAWRDWSQPRGLPPAEIEACRLERVDLRLVVHTPPRLLDQLRAARSDAVKQEAWLLAGEGRTRLAAPIELQAL